MHSSRSLPFPLHPQPIPLLSPSDSAPSPLPFPTPFDALSSPLSFSLRLDAVRKRWTAAALGARRGRAQREVRPEGGAHRWQIQQGGAPMVADMARRASHNDGSARRSTHGGRSGHGGVPSSGGNDAHPPSPDQRRRAAVRMAARGHGSSGASARSSGAVATTTRWGVAVASVIVGSGLVPNC